MQNGAIERRFARPIQKWRNGAMAVIGEWHCSINCIVEDAAYPYDCASNGAHKIGFANHRHGAIRAITDVLAIIFPLNQIMLTMNIIAASLVAASAAIALLLGCIHLLYTFYGQKLFPRDPALLARMQEISPVITRQTTMWKAWIGFNASHSYGLILFGVIYGYLALVHRVLLLQSAFLLSIGLGLLLGYVILCKKYFFRIPLVGMLLATALYVAALVFNA